MALGIPALILLGMSLVIWAFSKWYIGDVSAATKSIIVFLGIIIFLAPYTLRLLPSEQPKTYRDSLKQDREIREERCTMLRQKLGPSVVSQRPELYGCN